MPPLVTVSIPYHGGVDYVRRAVESVLAQTMPDLRCVVTNDADARTPPWLALNHIDDPRLVRVDRTVNRGRYHADAVVLAAVNTPWWTVHDADDAADPRWLETMLGVAEGRDVVFTAQTVVGVRGGRQVEIPKPCARDGELHHYGHMAGLWRTAWLKAVGGPHPGYRVGYDTLLSSVAHVAGSVHIEKRPLYTRYRRAGSLTTSKATGARSAYRQQQRARLRQLWTDIRWCTLPERVGALVRAESWAAWSEVRHDAQLLRRQMGSTK